MFLLELKSLRNFCEKRFVSECGECFAPICAHVSRRHVHSALSLNFSSRSLDITLGEKVFKKCAACHSIVKGGKNNIGPALYNVVGRKTGAVTDYKYSKALASFDKEWTLEELNGYLIKPAKWIKGTKMAFAGLRKEKDRASVIKYLNQNSKQLLLIGKAWEGKRATNLSQDI